MEAKLQNWYNTWFDSPYYHILYKDRDYREAEDFMLNLMNFLNLNQGSSILDLACGKGRHSIYLNKMGFDVTGIDLSENNIAEAKHFENKNLHFFVHNMCEPLKNEFDAVLNLFTSFGYFENPEDNFRTIKAIKNQIKLNGFGVIDFLNSDFVVDNLIPQEKKVIKGIDFSIERWIDQGFIFKNIVINDNNQHFTFTERVKAIRLSDFESCLKKVGLKLLHVFGDYELKDYNEKTSPRTILIFSR